MGVGGWQLFGHNNWAADLKIRDNGLYSRQGLGIIISCKRFIGTLGSK